MDERVIHDAYINVCRASGFRLRYSVAIDITARAINSHRAHVVAAFPDIETMEHIAFGNIPAAYQKDKQ